MNPILRNILAIIIGIVVGSIVNMGIIIYGPIAIPYPEGTNFSTPEGLDAAMASFEFKHFLVPFFAHAIGTLVGAFLAAKIAASHKMRLALIIGAVFLLGGIMMVMSLSNSPMIFNVTDLALAYIPAAWVGGKLTGAK